MRLTSQLSVFKQAQARRNVAKKPVTSISGCSGDLLLPSPPAQKTAARQDKAGKASTGNWDQAGR
jgi:hypothetical protein